MGILWKISKWYNRYQFLMWIIGILTAIATPLVGYASYLLSANNQHAELLSDSPEYADETTTSNLLQWLTGQAQGYGRLLGIIAVLGILVIVFCIVFTIINWIGRRTKVSGVDEAEEQQEKGRRQAAEDDRYDDYGQSREYD
ncbi:hypothetical protein EMO92_04560 [Bifidobacterium reuteri]|uniref:Uncharacterized protein n=1 Tax=Bifidobacterium reuteri TaxID=983706 RepID=A0A5J5E8F4_9BIFI|nr:MULTISPECIES: hypothetical protein [Bifidobacterium]KAA8825740.1 hypothetical protein EMO92_04560 [Bifidobacterium reuteri]TPF92173.1 hypothetical protein BW14_09895 [Bifidobacterium sp. UTBIF-68]